MRGTDNRPIPCYQGDQGETPWSAGRPPTLVREAGHASNRLGRVERRRGGEHRVEDHMAQGLGYMDEEASYRHMEKHFQHFQDEEAPYRHMEEHFQD